MTNLVLAYAAGAVAGIAFFCLTAREFSKLDLSDERIDQLINGEQPRFPSGFPLHGRGDNR